MRLLLRFHFISVRQSSSDPATTASHQIRGKRRGTLLGVKFFDDDHGSGAVAAGLRAGSTAIAAGTYGVSRRTGIVDPELDVFAATAASANRGSGGAASAAAA